MQVQQNIRLNLEIDTQTSTKVVYCDIANVTFISDINCTFLLLCHCSLAAKE